MTESQGGYLIPRVAYKRVPTVNMGWIRWIGSVITSAGYRIAIIGMSISGLGYHKEEYYPHDDIMKALSKIVADKGDTE